MARNLRGRLEPEAEGPERAQRSPDRSFRADRGQPRWAARRLPAWEIEARERRSGLPNPNPDGRAASGVRSAARDSFEGRTADKDVHAAALDRFSRLAHAGRDDRECPL